MSASTRPGQAGTASARELPDATIKSATAWVAQFARTLKTCRLYDAANPTVVRFRADLANSAQALFGQCGALTFRFGSFDVTLDGESLHRARSRDDNLAHPFHRDGVRALTFRPGVDAQDLNALIDAVLAVTGQNLDDDDLVTLLWEANLRFIDVDYIPAQGDIGGSESDSQSESQADEGEGPLMPWPTLDAAPPDGSEAQGGAEGATQAQPVPGEGRSEDWTLGDLTVEVEAGYAELDALAEVEVRRFRGEFAEEHQVLPVTAALAIGLACLHAGATDNDRRELGRYLPRVLRGAIGTGQWAEAREALRALRGLASPDWAEETFVQELLQPISVTRVVEQLDVQDPAGIAQFLALEREVGDPGIDWMTLALSESQQRATRQILAEALAQRCKQNPERLAPWLADSRWYVVRNMVHILGWIGGPEVVDLLQIALRNPEPRVRTQVVTALAQIDLKLGRPLLIRAIEGADTRLFCQILQQLSQARDPATARFLFAFMQQEKFGERPAEERRSIYAALASVGGDEIVHELEAELLKGNWFDRATEIHRHNIARCLMRFGTTKARDVLVRAADSKRAPVRQAAQAAIAAMERS